MSPWNENIDGPIDVAFTICCELVKKSSTLDTRQWLVKIIQARTQGEKDGVIIRNTSTNQYISLQFFGSNKSPRGEPWLQIQYVIIESLAAAEAYLDGDYVVLDVPSHVLNSMQRHMLKHAVQTGTYDEESGCEILHGFLAPMSAPLRT